MADALKGVPLFIFVLLALDSYNWANRLPPLVEVAIGVGEMALSLVLIVVLQVGLLRAGERPKRWTGIAINVLLLQPAFAGTIRLMGPVNAVFLNVLGQMGMTNWTVLIPLLLAMLLCFSLVSWLIIVMARRATAYILP